MALPWAHGRKFRMPQGNIRSEQFALQWTIKTTNPNQDITHYIQGARYWFTSTFRLMYLHRLGTSIWCPLLGWLKTAKQCHIADPRRDQLGLTYMFYLWIFWNKKGITIKLLMFTINIIKGRYLIQCAWPVLSCMIIVNIDYDNIVYLHYDVVNYYIYF